jgi:hypothetical protein
MPRAAAGGVNVEPFYLVAIEGDPGRASGLLALVRIQNVDYREGAVTAWLRLMENRPTPAARRLRGFASKVRSNSFRC